MIYTGGTGTRYKAQVLDNRPSGASRVRIISLESGATDYLSGVTILVPTRKLTKD